MSHGSRGSTAFSSTNFPFPSSTQTSSTNSPSAKLLTGILLTAFNPFPTAPPPPAASSSSSSSPHSSCLLRCCCKRCIPSACTAGSETIHCCPPFPALTPIGLSAFSRNSIASVNVQSAGSGDRRGRRELKRASVERNCWMRFSGGGGGGGSGGGLLVMLVAGAVEVGAGEEKGVKCSEIGTMGKRDVQNVYFSNGVETGKGESMMRDVEWRVHYMNSLPPLTPASAPPPTTGGWSRIISAQATNGTFV